MKAVDALLFLVAIAGGLWALVTVVRRGLLRGRAREPWKVEQHTRPDGAIVVELRRPGEAPKMIGQPIREADAADTAATLRVYREDAELVADELNRRRK